MKINNAVFDVVVVGAGPTGSVIAEALAQASLRVALLEEHVCVGLPNHCSGLVSPRTLELVEVTPEAVNGIPFISARVWSPGGKTLWLRSDSVQAIAIDRPKFDRILAERAASAGAVLILGSQAYRFERSGQGVRVDAQTEAGDLCLHASLLIGADGAGSQVARWMDHGAGVRKKSKSEIVSVMKADIVFQNHGTDSIEIFVGNGIAPGWFGWVIPIQNGIARIGVGAARAGAGIGLPRDCLEVFLNMIRSRFGPFTVKEFSGSVLPLGPAHTFAADRVMLVGAAARQTKPTTGGGIYFGIRAARLAAATAAKAIEKGDCSLRTLMEYEQAWHRLEGRELLYGHWLRRGFRRLSDKDLDLMIEMLGNTQAQGLISRLGDIDFPSRLFVPLVATMRKRSPLEAIGIDMEALYLVSTGT
jgi:digeranylgeranylglycerophospholipid reductase